jgi:hypothetical protein
MIMVSVLQTPRHTSDRDVRCLPDHDEQPLGNRASNHARRLMLVPFGFIVLMGMFMGEYWCEDRFPMVGTAGGSELDMCGLLCRSTIRRWRSESAR